MSPARIGIGAGLALLVAGVFHPVVDYDFVNYDDGLYVTENPMLRDGLGLDSVARAFRPYETNWIPLTWISLQLDHALYGDEPAGYHRTNVALHALGTLLLFFALARMTRAPGPSAFVAAVFAVHPLHVESVAWVSERKDVLAGVFWMGALVAWARYAERPGPGPMAAVTACLGLGLMAKPMLVTLPFALLLLDYWPLGRLRRPDGSALPDPARLRRALLEKAPLFALVAAASALTFWVQRDTGAMSHDGALPLGYRLANAVASYGVYLRQSVWPLGLAVFYPHPLGSLPPWRTALEALGLAALTLLALRAAGARPYLTVGWLWYLGTLVPVIGLVQVGMQAHADRYLYVPLIGLTLALAWSVRAWVGDRRPRRLAAVAGAAAAIAALALLAHRQVATWRDTETLFRHAIQVTERNFLAHHGLATVLLAEGRVAEAEPHFAEALRLKPRWAGAHAGLGDLHLRTGDAEAAAAAYRRALELAPRHARARAGLAQALLDAGRPGEAAAELRRALRVADDDARAELLALLGAALARDGAPERAIEHYRRALALAPGSAEILANLGFALQQQGRLDEAQDVLERTRAAGLDSAALHLALAEGARGLNRPRQAARHYRAALERDPDSSTAANNLAWLLATHPDPAVRDPAAALALAERLAAGSEPALLDTLAAAQAAAGRSDAARRTAARAVRLARERGDAALADEIAGRLALYEAGRAFVGSGR